MFKFKLIEENRSLPSRGRFRGGLLGGLLLSTILVYGQANISPAKPQSKPVVITGGTIHIGNGQVINNGYVAFTNEKINAVEEGAKGTVDDDETGEYNPNIRSIVAYNTDSKVIPTVRSNGILLAQPTPAGGVISGESSVVQLDAWNWEDAAYKTDIGIHLTWPVARVNTRRRALPTPGVPQESPA